MRITQIGARSGPEGRAFDDAQGYPPGGARERELDARRGSGPEADVALPRQSLLRLRANTQITLEGLTDDETALLDLLKEAAHCFSRSDARSLEVKTPFAVAGVRGSEFYVAV